MYDNDQRLIKVFAGRDSLNLNLQGAYKYYLHGPLKRMEIGGATQGIDFTYTINGELKSINSGDPSLDPGQDGLAGGTNASFLPDAFGETLLYYDLDYVGAQYNSSTLTLDNGLYPNQFGGNLRAVTYNNATEKDYGNGVNSKRIYAFQYDPVNRLSNSQWGSINSGVPNFGESQREQVTSYDDYGIIKGLLRKGKTGLSTANYTYVYETNKNRLDKINNSGSLLVDYTFNNSGQLTQQAEGAKTMNIGYSPSRLVTEVRNAA